MEKEICWNDPDCWRQAFILQADKISSKIEPSCKFSKGSNELLKHIIKTGEEKILEEYRAYTNTLFEKYKRDTEIEDIRHSINIERINDRHKQNFENEVYRKGKQGTAVLIAIVIFIIICILIITTKK